MAEKKKTPQPHPTEALERIKAKFKDHLQQKRERRKKEQAEAQEATKRQHQAELKRILNGTTYEKVLAVFRDLDISRTSAPTIFTDEEMAQIRATINGTKQAQEANRYVSFYNAITQIYQTLGMHQAGYRKYAAELTALIKTYEGYLAAARVWSNLFTDGTIGISNADSVSFEFGEGTDGRLWADRKIGSGWGTLTIHRNGDWEVDIEGYTESGEPRLYERMVKQAAVTEAQLSLFKSYVEAVEDIICNTEAPVWALIPLPMEQLLEYPDYIPEQNQKAMERYFRFPLNQHRRESGQEPTQEEEKWALYPDINEVETTEINDSDAKALVNVILDRWQLDSNTLQKICAEAKKGTRKR